MIHGYNKDKYYSSTYKQAMIYFIGHICRKTCSQISIIIYQNTLSSVQAHKACNNSESVCSHPRQAPVGNGTTYAHACIASNMTTKHKSYRSPKKSTELFILRQFKQMSKEIRN